MPPKKDNLPINVDVDLENGGSITYANEVIAIIAGVAANEIEGIAGMCTSGGVGDIFGRNRNITRGVKVEIGSEEASVDLYAIVEYGQPIQKVASEVQENVRKAIETMTGLRVVRVDVHVQGVSFEKEKKAVQNTIDSAHMPSLAPVQKEEPIVTPVEEAPAEEAISEESLAEEEPVTADAAPEDAEAPAQDEPCACCDDGACACGEAACDGQPSAEDAPAEEAPIEDAFIENAPAEEASAEDIPAAETPAEDAPVEEASAEEAAKPRSRAKRAKKA